MTDLRPAWEVAEELFRRAKSLAYIWPVPASPRHPGEELRVHPGFQDDAAKIIERRDDEVRRATAQEAADLLEAAWGIIANASGGDWTKQTPEWQDAAARWRDDHFHSLLPTPSGGSGA